MKKYEFLDEYTADVAFIAYGKSLEEVFENAAYALMEIQTDVSRIEPKECFSVRVEGFDLEHLMKKWLEELLYYLDAKQIILGKFDVNIKSASSEEGEILILEGKVCGELFDPNKHISKVEVKAVSYHDMRIGKKNDTYFARVLVDI